MPRPKKNHSIIDETAAYFAQGQRVKARLEHRLTDLRKETEEVESALSRFEPGPRLLPPVAPPPPSNDANEENNRKTSPVSAELLTLRHFYDFLSPKQREIVELRASGMKPAAISEKLKIGTNTVSTTIFLAKKKLVAAREQSTKPTKPAQTPSDADEPDQEDHRSSFTSYMDDVRHHDVMTREEEHKVALEYTSTGSRDMANKLVTSNLKLVVKIANEYRKSHRDVADLIQEGNMGLLHAVKKYDPNRGVRFPSYASHWIRAYILKFVLSNWRLVKIGTTQAQRKMFFNLRKTKAKLEKEGIPVDAEHLAAALGVKAKQIEQMDIRMSAPDASLDATAYPDDERTIGNAISSPRHERPDSIVEASQVDSILKNSLRQFESGLNERDLEIFQKRLMADEPATLVELASIFGVTRERVRQIEMKLRKKLRDHLDAELDDELDDIRHDLAS